MENYELVIGNAYRVINLENPASKWAWAKVILVATERGEYMEMATVLHPDGEIGKTYSYNLVDWTGG